MAISPQALVSAEASVGPDVHIEPFCLVHDGVELGSGTHIGAYCEIGLAPADGRVEVLHVGAGALIRSHSVVYRGSILGEQLETGHRVTVREGTRTGRGVRIGTLCDLQGDCEIGEYARLHSGVFVAKGSVIGRFAWLMPHVMLTNDPTPPSNHVQGCVIGDYAVVAARAVVMPGVKIGEGAVVAAGACVTRDVPAGMVAMGIPARVVGPASAIALRGGDRGAAYPWARHFERGYPPELVQRWRAQAQRD
jgi:acetyltransferase-like isoleucine patch superfamily enzyme